MAQVFAPNKVWPMFKVPFRKRAPGKRKALLALYGVMIIGALFSGKRQTGTFVSKIQY